MERGNKTETETGAAKIRNAAISLLAQREHSRLELVQKLQRRFGPTDLIASVVECLAEDNLQSDARFAESFVSARMRRGQGPLRIAMELKERGVSEDLCRTVLDLGEDVWCELARSVWQKRFGAVAADSKAKAKQIRFLRYRGFMQEHINVVLSYFVHDP
ncbi:MAG: regulatory protein RecX [Exilibacterium sp.]